MPRPPLTLARIAALTLLAAGLQGCIVATAVDTAFDVAVGTVKVGAAVVGGTVKVAAAGVKAVAGDDEDKDPQSAQGKNNNNSPDASATTGEHTTP